MPTFSIKDLLIATAMVAVGLTSLLSAFRYAKSINTGIEMLLYYGGSMLLCAGLLFPIKRASHGALLGLVGGVLVPLVWLMLSD
jgi:hypothetical protein